MTANPDFSAFTHAKLVEHDDSVSIIYSPGGPADAHLSPVFAAHSLEGSGYDWQSAIHASLLDSPVLERFGFDSEGGMFCAYGTDRAALHEVATLLEALLADPERLAAALAVAVEHDLLD
ncbi:Imm51 family immunity protein [Glycomyces sp. NPDC046736]|uniref:Imm51 family immunity protein n=1 Tax=Glycomyces sp. NPDC046736 TaxID=3155615 RepID=UPI0033E4E930